MTDYLPQEPPLASEPIVTVPPVSPVPPRKFPLVLALLIPVLVVAAVISIYVLLQARTMYQQAVATPAPTPQASADPTADWQIFTSEAYGFSIKYPHDWEGNCQDTTGKWLSGNICDLRAKNTVIDHGRLSSGASVIVGIEKPNPNYKNIEEKIAFDSEQYGYSISPKSINGISGYVYIGQSNEVFVTQRNDYYFSISWIPVPKDSDYQSQIDQILSTFKFTN